MANPKPFLFLVLLVLVPAWAEAQDWTGTYVGTVDDLTNRLSARVEEVVRQEGNVLYGCVSIHAPLEGSGAWQYEVRGNVSTYTRVEPTWAIQGRGQLNGDVLTGEYVTTVTNGAQTRGTYRLQRVSRQGLPAGFDLRDCPTAPVPNLAQYIAAVQQSRSPSSGASPATSTGSAGSEIRQWAHSATASSQYSPDAWSARRATGAPDTSGCGDIPTAWAPASNGEGPEWIELEFAIPVRPTRLRVHETQQSGSIIQVDVRDTAGNLQTVWRGADSATCPGWFEINISGPPGVTVVRLYTRISGWEEIDAVELIGEGSPVQSGNPEPGPAAGGSPPEIVVITPTDQEDVAADRITVRGIAVDARAVTSVRVAGRVATMQPRSERAMEFWVEGVGLQPGENRIEIVAKNVEGIEGRATVKVRRVEMKPAEPAKPSGLSLEGIIRLLEAGVTPARLETIVKDRGVDFELTPDAEKKLREAGASDALLLSVAKAKP